MECKSGHTVMKDESLNVGNNNFGVSFRFGFKAEPYEKNMQQDVQ